VVFERTEVVLEVNAPARGILVINEAFWPGWRATVDQRDVGISRANYLFRAIYLDQGAHRVHLRFKPPGLTPALYLFATTILALIALAGWSVTRRLRRR
jgi:uncharacterized membrane protein YfhO